MQLIVVGAQHFLVDPTNLWLQGGMSLVGTVLVAAWVTLFLSALHNPGAPAAEVLSGMFAKLVPVFLVRLGKYFIFFFAYLLCVIPFFFALTYFSLVDVYAFRGEGVHSFSASARKIEGNKLTMLAVYLVLGLLYLGVVFVLWAGLVGVAAFAGESMAAPAPRTAGTLMYSVFITIFAIVAVGYTTCLEFSMAELLDDESIDDEVVDVFA